MPVISVVIPSFWWGPEAWEMTKECMASATIGNQSADQIIVVDDASPWKPHSAWDRFVSREMNGGYPAAVNAGVAKARGDKFLILNNDATLRPDTIQEMMELHAAIGGKGVVTATDPNSDGQTPCGACWLIDHESWEKVGKLDESFGVGAFEDTDYWYRCREAGVPVVRSPHALIDHIGSATIKRTPAHKEQYERNRKEVIRRWGSDVFLLER